MTQSPDLPIPAAPAEPKRRRRGPLARLAQCALAGLLLAAPLLPGTAGAQTSSATGTALGAMRAVFYHELGHGLVDELKLPTVGPEEDVVDEFATYMLILTGQRDDRQVQALISAAEFWWLTANATGAGPAWGPHSPSRRRAYAIICLMHGSDPGRFYPIVQQLQVPHFRARVCEREYREKVEKWIAILQPHFRSGQNANRAGLVAQYIPASQQETRNVASLWEQTRFLESLANEANAIFGLPRNVPVIGRSCGEPNAYWTGSQIVLCYEMQVWIEALMAESAKSSQQGGSQGGGQGSGGGQGGGQSGGQSNSAEAPQETSNAPAEPAQAESATGGLGGLSTGSGSQNLNDLLK
ncbi:MAG: DUF4344 domain-containing metallopeptidase [Pseudomonadota bacterium]